jgi:hypothetical protein
LIRAAGRPDGASEDRPECVRVPNPNRRTARAAQRIALALALSVYSQAMRRDEHQQAQLRALVEGADWANLGERGANAAPAEAAPAPKTAVLQALRP